MSGMEGTCSNCGAHYYGWALDQPRYQFCKCGGALEIRRDGVLMPSGPFDIKNLAGTEMLVSRFVLNEDISLVKN